MARMNDRDEPATEQFQLRLTKSEVEAIDREVARRNKKEPGVYTRTALIRSWVLRELQQLGLAKPIVKAGGR
jgi:hypothetical protein